MAPLRQEAMHPDLSTYPLWNVDPVMLRIGPAEIRYYSLFFFLVFVLGYVFFIRQMERGGHSALCASRMLIWAPIAVIAGGRIVHCLFYEPDYYLAHPWQILDVRRGGLASHGSALGLVIAFVLFARWYRYSILEVFDRFALSAMLGASMVRFGNFFNSEIVGREWYGPWAIRFERFAQKSQRHWEAAHGPLGWTVQPLPRHPVQLYEGLGMIAIFAVAYLVDRRLGEHRPRGMLIGLTLTLYFSFRFGIEYLKEYQRFATLEPDPVMHVIRVVPTADVTMGQWLSLPFALAFFALFLVSLRLRLPAAVPSPSDELE
jgi:phosphatidylglycerol:prolipoprotein diacylglycerol transferase